MMYANIYLYYFSSSFEIERPTLISFVFVLLFAHLPCALSPMFVFCILMHDL